MWEASEAGVEEKVPGASIAAKDQDPGETTGHRWELRTAAPLRFVCL